MYSEEIQIFDAVNFDPKQIATLLEMDYGRVVLITELMRANAYAELEVTEKRIKRAESEAKRKSRK